LDFLDGNRNYNALIFSDLTHEEMLRETKVVKKADHLSIDLLPRGGFAMRIVPADN
jgi:hypothetical protein